MNTNRIARFALVALPVLAIAGATGVAAFSPAGAKMSEKDPVATTIVMENEQENPEVTYPDVENDPAAKALAGVLQIDSCGELGNQPEEITLACGDANSVVTGLEWTNWGAESAGATGNFVESDCDPDCANGTDQTYPVVVIAEGIEKGEASARYTHLVIEFADKVPAGHQAIETVELPGLG